METDDMGSRKQNDTVGQGQGRKGLKVGLGGIGGVVAEGEGVPFGREIYWRQIIMIM